MKTIKNIFAAVMAIGLLALGAGRACAQQDAFGQMQSVVLCPPTQVENATGAIVNAPGLTNNYVDLHGFDGIGAIYLYCQTNAGAGTLTMTLQGSPDTTNWTTVSNFAVGVSNNLIYTNRTYTTAVYGTNFAFTPGTITTPTAATAGFANLYLAAATFNSNGVFVVSGGQGVYQLGIGAQDMPTYLRTTWVPTGANTNYSVSALFIGKRR